MFSKLRFFYFSDASLGYHPVKYFKTKVACAIACVGIGLFGLLFLLNFFLGDPLQLSKSANLASENRVLRDQIRTLTQQTSFVERSINELVDLNNQLRLLVDLGKIDNDTKQVGIGGSVSKAEFSFLTPDASKLLTTSNEALSRLEREVELQKKSYTEITKQYEFNKEFFKHLPAIKPCEGPYSLNGFGMRIHPVLGIWRMHDGLDINIDVGTPVYAAGDGIVHFAGKTQSGYGAVIELSHGYGYSTLYAHLSKVLVREGYKVKRGALIARTGRSGLVSGPHLHYEVRLNGRKQNPVDYFFDNVDAARYRTQLASAK